MEITAETVCTQDVYLDYYRFNMTKGSNPKLKHIFIISIDILLFCICLVKITLFGADYKMAILLILSVIIFAGYLFLYYVSPKTVFRTAKNLANMKSTYVFKDDEFDMTSENSEYSGNCTVKYSALYKVYETDKYIYFYIQTAQAYVLEKSGLVGGTSEQLRDAVSKSLPQEKYIICK